MALKPAFLLSIPLDLSPEGTTLELATALDEVPVPTVFWTMVVRVVGVETITGPGFVVVVVGGRITLIVVLVVPDGVDGNVIGTNPGHKLSKAVTAIKNRKNQAKT